jgi:hypothetical protein
MRLDIFTAMSVISELIFIGNQMKGLYMLILKYTLGKQHLKEWHYLLTHEFQTCDFMLMQSSNSN